MVPSKAGVYVMRKSIAIVLALVSVGFSSWGVQMPQGSKEFAIEGSFDNESSDGDKLDMGVFYGEFFEDNLEAGIQFRAFNTDHVKRYSGGVRFEYNNTNYQVVPFVAASFEYAHVDVRDIAPPLKDDAFVIGGHAGLKLFLAENIAISGAIVYEWATQDIYEKDDNKLGDNHTSLRLGMRYFF